MARITKKDIYAKYGIVYDTKTQKIFHPTLGWVKELLVDGNDKIGKGVWHFSTLPTNSAFVVDINGTDYELTGTCPCFCSGCYATRGNYNYADTKNALGMRTWLAYNDLDYVKRAVTAQMEIYHVRFVRIHASGDFFSIDYVAMWQQICIEHPNTIFWTYTKLKQAETAFDDIPNANIVKSVIPHVGVNFGHCEYILATYEYLRSHGKSVWVCKCGTDKNQHCINCKGCMLHEYVLFIEHSTEYKAEKDPLYPVLKTLIESQAE